MTTPNPAPRPELARDMLAQRWTGIYMGWVWKNGYAVEKAPPVSL